MEVGDALAEQVDGYGQHLHACALVARRAGRQLEDVDVEQGLVVVVLDVVHDLIRRRHIAGRLCAAIGDIGQTHVTSAVIGHHILAQRTGQPDAYQVGGAQQVLAGAGRALVAVVVKTVDVALLRDQAVVVVAGSAAAYGVAGTVTEGRDAAAVQ